MVSTSNYFLHICCSISQNNLADMKYLVGSCYFRLRDLVVGFQKPEFDPVSSKLNTQRHLGKSVPDFKHFMNSSLMERVFKMIWTLVGSYGIPA